MNKDNYLMQGADGVSYVVNTTSGAEHVAIMSQKEVIYDSKK